MKKLLNFVKDWSDVLLLLPVALIAVLFNSVILRSFDATSDILMLDPGFLALLMRNIVVWVIVSVASYYLAQTYFGFDVFKRGFFDKLTPFQSAIISIILWISTVIFTSFILLQDVLF